jgi:hypothetical protein
MVRVGFIVEGDSEKVLIESEGFKRWASEQGLEICQPVINAKGGGNLLPHHIEPMLAQLSQVAPQHIVVLTDLDNAPDVAAVKERITLKHTTLIFVAVKALEAWFLADTQAMCSWLRTPSFTESEPENTPGMPWDHLGAVAKLLGARGPGPNKVIFARNFCKLHGFQLPRAAMHPSCPSAREFHDALMALGAAGGPRSAGGGLT